MCALKQGKGLVAKGDEEKGQGSEKLIGNAICRFLFKVSFLLHQTEFFGQDEDSPKFTQLSSQCCSFGIVW